MLDVVGAPHCSVEFTEPPTTVNDPFVCAVSATVEDVLPSTSEYSVPPPVRPGVNPEKTRRHAVPSCRQRSLHLRQAVPSWRNHSLALRQALPSWRYASGMAHHTNTSSPATPPMPG